MFDFGGLTWRELVRDVSREAREKDLMGWAAQLAFFFVLSLFPLLLFLMLLLGFLTGERAQLRDSLLYYLSAVAPVSTSHLIDTTVEDLNKSSSGRGGVLSFGLLAALWAASNGLRVISRALNAAYNVEQRRKWWHERLLAISLTLALGAMIVVAVALLLYGGDIAEQIAISFGLGQVFTLTWKLVQYPLVLVFVLLTFSAIYYFAPNLENHKWKWLAPGTLIGVVLWLAISFAFRAYLRNFSTIRMTYGSFASVIVLMLWCYLTGAAILLGGFVNAVVTHAKNHQATR